MRKLTKKEIEQLKNAPGVDAEAVEDYLERQRRFGGD